MTWGKDLRAEWAKVRGTIAPRPSAVPDAPKPGRADTGEYRLLYKYLRERYADRVVLTFGEIEDLIGFALPGPARLQREWWGETDPIAHRSAQSDSWTLASRTATVNLAAQNVVFERHNELRPVRT